MAGPGRPLGSKTKEKPFYEALRIALAEAGPDHKALRRIANALIERAAGGDIQAVKEIADRLDGKVAQSVTGEDDGPIRITFEWVGSKE